MSNNPENRIGASLTLVGYTSGEARNPAYDKDGSKGVKEIAIAINEGYTKDGEFVKTGTTWYTYSAAGDYADTLVDIPKGSKVRIEDAKLEVREYKANDGTTKLGHSLRFGTITVLEEGRGEKATASAGASKAAASDDGW
jgi:single-stranded DNA-binding protein